MAKSVDQEYEDYLKQQQDDADYEKYVKESGNLGKTLNEPAFTSPDWMPGMPSEENVAGALAATDFLDSPVRAGVSEFAKGKYITGDTSEKLQSIVRGIKSAGSQLATNIESPIKGPAQAPSYGEIIDREMRMNTIPNLLTTEKQKQASAIGGNLAMEAAIPSATFAAMSKVPKVGATLSNFLSKSKQALRRTETNQMAKIIANLESRAQFDPKVSNINPETVAQHLVDADISKHASDPVKMYEAITGENPTKFEHVGEGTSKEVYTKGDGGLIGKKLSVMKDEVIEAANKAGRDVRVPTFALKEKIKQRQQLTDPLSGERYSPTIMARREKIMDEMLKPLDEELVPGIPLEAARENPRFLIPPITPDGPADMFPMSRQGNIPDPKFPMRPEHPGMDFPGNPPTDSHFNLIKINTPPPKQPQAYGGIVTKEAQEQYLEEYASWEAREAKSNAAHEKATSEAKALDESRRVGQEKTRASLADDVNAKYDSAIKAWEEEVTRLTRETKEARASGMAYDEKVMQAKVKQAAERFEARAKKNVAYKKEIMEADEEYRQHLIEALNSKVFKIPRTWSLKDMMSLRSNIGKRLASKDFNTNAALSLEKDVATSIYDSLRDEISGTLKGLPTKVPDARTGGFLDASEHYDIQSKAVHRLMQAAEVLKDSKFYKLKGADRAADAMAALAGIGIGVTTLGAGHMLGGSDFYLPATAVGLMGARTAYKTVKGEAPEMLVGASRMARKGIEGIEKYPEQAYKALNLGTRAIRDNYVIQNDQGEETTVNQTPQGFERPKSLPKDVYKMFPNLAPKSTMITPKQMINYRIPRTTQGILDNKEMVMGKLIQNSIPEELINTIAQALDGDTEDIANIAPLVAEQFPNIFEKSKYKVFDGILAPTDRPKAADAIAKREDMNSIQRAKAIDGINKSGKFPQELA